MWSWGFTARARWCLNRLKLQVSPSVYANVTTQCSSVDCMMTYCFRQLREFFIKTLFFRINSRYTCVNLKGTDFIHFQKLRRHHWNIMARRIQEKCVQRKELHFLCLIHWHSNMFSVFKCAFQFHLCMLHQPMKPHRSKHTVLCAPWLVWLSNAEVVVLLLQCTCQSCSLWWVVGSFCRGMCRCVPQSCLT